MLDRGVGVRIAVAWILALCSVVTGFVAWRSENEALGHVVAVLVIFACTLTVLHDSAKTRRVVREMSFPDDEDGTAPRVRSIR